MLRAHVMATTQHQYKPPRMSSLGQINQRRIKTKISQTPSTASPLKILRAHVMATTQHQYQPPRMSSLGQINQRRIKTKISQNPSTPPPLHRLKPHSLQLPNTNTRLL